MKRSSSCTTCRPVSSIASRITTRSRLRLGEARGQNLAQRRILLKRGDVLVLDLPLLHPAPHLFGELAGQYAFGLQGPETFRKNGCGHDGGRG